MKKLISILTCLILLLSLFCISASAEEAPVKDGKITLSVTLDKSEYLVGEDIAATLELKNNLNESIFYVTDGTDSTLYSILSYKYKSSYFYGGTGCTDILLPYIVCEEVKPGQSVTQSVTFKSEYYIASKDYFFSTHDSDGYITADEPGEYTGKAWADFTFTEMSIGNYTSSYKNDKRISLDFTVNILDEPSGNEITPKTFSITKSVEEFEDILPPEDDPTGENPAEEADISVTAVGAKKISVSDGDSTNLYATVRNYGEEEISKTVNVDFYCKGTLCNSVKEEVTIPAGGYVNITSSEPVKFSFGSTAMRAVISIDKEKRISGNTSVKSRLIVE